MVDGKEAIERLYNMKNKVDVALMNSKREKGDWLYDDVQGTADTLRMAINALEKHIPKKPEYEADGYADGNLVYDYAKCPICGHDFEYGINDWGCEYCSDCGQKLDWSDEE